MACDDDRGHHNEPNHETDRICQIANELKQSELYTVSESSIAVSASSRLLG